MSITNRELIVEVRADVSHLQSDMQRVNTILENSNKQVSKIGDGFKSALGALSAVFTVQKLVETVKSGVQAYSNLQATMLKFNLMFGSNSVQMMDWANKFGGSLGMLGTSVAQYANDFADMFEGMGLGKDKVRDLSKALLQITFDMQSMNRAMVTTKEEAVTLMQSGLAGNYESFRRLGIQINEGILKQRMFQMGLKGTFADLTSQTKLMVLYTEIMKQYNNQQASGFAQKSATATLEGALTMMSEKWKQILQVIGGAVVPTMLFLGNIFMTYLAPAIMFIAGGIYSMTNALFNSAPAFTLLAAIVGVLAFKLIYTSLIAMGAFVASTYKALIGCFQMVGGFIMAATGATAFDVALFPLIATILIVAGLMVALFSLFGKSFKMPSFKPDVISPADMAKGLDMGSMAGSNSDKKKSGTAKQVSQEQQLNSRLKDEYDKRVKDYSNVTNTLLGVQRKFITSKGILIASEQSKQAIMDFNEGIAQLENRLKGSSIGKDFVNQLETLDPNEYADYVQALAGAGDGELQQIVANFGTRHTEAMVTAKKAVVAMTPELTQQVKATGDAAGKAGGSALGTGLKASSLAGIAGATDPLNDAVKKMQNSMNETMKHYEWFGLKEGLTKALSDAHKSITAWFNSNRNGFWQKAYDVTFNVSKNADGSPNWDNNTKTPYATGGIFTGYSSMGNSIFGEAGHEAVVPLSPSGLRPWAEAMQKYGSMGSGVNVQNMYVRNDNDVKKVAQELYNLQRADARKKGYGYGY